MSARDSIVGRLCFGVLMSEVEVRRDLDLENLDDEGGRARSGEVLALHER